VLLPALVADGSTNSINPGSTDKATSSISQQAVCQLLCSSKAIGKAVRSECSGQLCANFSARSLQQAQHFASWLAHNGSLVKQLQFSLHTSWVDGGAFSAGAPAILACAISAAASCGTLQHLQSVVDHMPSPTMLNALSGISSLTSLQLDFTSVKDWYGGTQAAAYSSDDDSDDDDQRHPQSAGNSKLTEHLSRLTHLRKLSLNWPHETRNPLWRPLANLAQLTALTMTCCDFSGLSRVDTPWLLAQGPTSLQKLELIPTPRYWDGDSHWLQPHPADIDMQPLESLHNLKLLTELRAPGSTLDISIEVPHFHGNHDAQPQMLRDLPDSLQVLQLGSARSDGIQQLLLLPQLRELSLQQAAHMTGWDLLLLEGMPGLTSLQLNYYPPEQFDDDYRHLRSAEAEEGLVRLCGTMEVHAAHWPALPLCRLIIIIINPCKPYLTASAPRLTHWGGGK
jgi:hypothetical protein